MRIATPSLAFRLSCCGLLRLFLCRPSESFMHYFDSRSFGLRGKYRGVRGFHLINNTYMRRINVSAFLLSVAVMRSASLTQVPNYQ
ncbi:uncharacterized protein EDB91DRAFT_1110542 [Suillus paluster]|uniref:uncharacterized protein n=1 Tax=Suillus paluster TaxID=48578 RepID=UPI001B865627|nr:uncharacterized protein EDB91DRAFT_1110542 [Suillus paluster]KAG1749950.1 hypothetical protein EDB91DRAFT_1110542 [Suillus paluster]